MKGKYNTLCGKFGHNHEWDNCLSNWVKKKENIPKQEKFNIEQKESDKKELFDKISENLSNKISPWLKKTHDLIQINLVKDKTKLNVSGEANKNAMKKTKKCKVGNKSRQI